MPTYRGPHRITVTGVEAEWPQRAVVTVRGGRTIVVPGEPGAGELIDAEDWDLAVEHCHRGVWEPNIRAVVGRWEETGGVRRQLVRSTDRERPGNPGGRNLVLRIEREDPRPAAAPAPAALRRTTTESAAPNAATWDGRPGPAARTSTSTSTSTGIDAPPVRTTTTSGGWTASS
ncbi:hypothetical protein [Kitasatospora sp. MBT63]|uniref:hypothetical protein n=1 Tax=Kitasatospora sp. MBT63 TaxID=1444768 RepID=UPI00053AFFC6|nr:hypothetical protein [Kitasatospora sp. MBT63]